MSLENCTARRLVTAEISGVRGRQRLGCMDGVKVALGSRVVTEEAPVFIRTPPPLVANHS